MKWIFPRALWQDLCLVLLVLCFLPGRADAAGKGASNRIVTDLSGSGWQLWLDRKAEWKNDKLFPPPVDLRKVPVHPPTGGWGVLQSNMTPVSVPGTVEEYFQPGTGPAGDIKGVSWWVRKVKIPEANSPRRLLLQFGAVRQRAEVFVNHKLVGYDIVGNTPFEVDISGVARPGETIELAVRVTDPGGDFNWRDSSPFHWGKYLIPMSHGFGGITGHVRLISCAPVYVDDVYVQNTPAITNVNVIATIKNTTGKKLAGKVWLKVVDKAHAAELNRSREPDGLSEPNSTIAFESKVKSVGFALGDNKVLFHVSMPNAKIWDLDQPNLYVCQVNVQGGETCMDSSQRTFGFRWFAPEGIGSNAVFRLNGKRIVLRTAISWGFWPINGIFPTPKMARKEIQDAKALGLNMLNFHRSIGQPEVLDDADKLGLLFYEEPGGYVNGDLSPFAKKLARAKLFRMVKRDRSHPSLVIYNMINEAWDSGGASRNPAVFAGHVRDMREAHALDPSRTITHTSAWAKSVGGEGKAKMHMRPFDNTVYMKGWYDYHHAGGPPVWQQSLYKSPEDYYNRTTDKAEIVYWGEEGAISTPPRLAKIKEALDHSPHIGWDGQIYLNWYRRFDDFLTRKHLRSAFPAVDALTTALGAVSYYHQGRKIELMRLNNITDGYAINGWESESVENHSGIVDCWRNLKADPAILAYYNQPLYVAVMARSQFVEIPGKTVVDFYLINEKNVHGEHTLRISLDDPAGQEVFSREFPVTVAGGEVYGQLLTSDVTVPVAHATGMFKIKARLLDGFGTTVATGREKVLAVDWRSGKLDGNGATWESEPQVRDFLQKEKHLPVKAYTDKLGHLDWVVVTRPPYEGDAVEIPAKYFKSGLHATFCNDREFRNVVYERQYKNINYSVPAGAAPDQHSSMTENYGIRWEGILRPPRSGRYAFAIESNGGVRLWVNGVLVITDPRHANSINRAHVNLEAGKLASVRLEFWHRKGDARCKLLWSAPETKAPDPAGLLNRVKEDGTTLFILDRADTWMKLIETDTAIQYHGSFKVGTAWLGGLHFVRAHPLFKDLPVNTAMDWPYQAVVRDGRARTGLRLEGEQLVVGAWHSYPMDLGTAVGVIPCGKGKIVVSTLNITDELNSSDTSACVARKLLCNFIAFH